MEIRYIIFGQVLDIQNFSMDDLFTFSQVSRGWNFYFKTVQESLAQNPLDWSIQHQRLDLVQKFITHKPLQILLLEKYRNLLLDWNICSMKDLSESFSNAFFFAMGSHEVSEFFLQKMWCWIHEKKTCPIRMNAYHIGRIYQGDENHLYFLFSSNKEAKTCSSSLDYAVSFRYWVERYYMTDEELMWKILGYSNHPQFFQKIESLAFVSIPWTKIFEHVLEKSSSASMSYILENHANDVHWETIIDRAIQKGNVAWIEICLQHGGVLLPKLFERLGLWMRCITLNLWQENFLKTLQKTFFPNRPLLILPKSKNFLITS